MPRSGALKEGIVLFPAHRRLSNLLLHYSLPLALAVCALALQSGGAAISAALRYERAAIAAGEWWRLLSGHLVHLGWPHLGLNLAGLALVWLLVGPYLSVRAWWITALACMAGTSAGLLLGLPDLAWYVGLSGMLHGLLVAGAIVGATARHKDMLLLLLGIAAKLAWEQWQGPLPGSIEAAGGPVVVEAHLYGAISGALAGGALLMRQWSERLRRRSGGP